VGKGRLLSMNLNKSIFVSISISLLLLISVSAHADTIYLNDGHIIYNAKNIREEGKFIYFEIEGWENDTRSYLRSHIKRIEKKAIDKNKIDVSSHPELDKIIKSSKIKATKHIDISYQQVMHYLSNFFHMEKGTPVRNAPRYMGRTKDGTAVLEVIGDKRNIIQASVMLGFPIDERKITIQNSAILLRFIKNTVPEMENPSDWATNSLNRLRNYPDQPVEAVKGNKRIKMQLLKPLGLITTTVKHR
jgi:hypothetical protein